MNQSTNTDMQSGPLKQKTVYSVLLAISLAHLLNDMMQSVIPSIYPLIKGKFGFTFAQIGIITLMFQLTSSLLQPFVGRYTDRHPKPYSLAAGMGFTLTGLLMLSVANSFYTILASVCIIGCGSSIFHPEASQVAQTAAGGRKGLAQSIFQVGGNGGTAIGPLLAALIVIPNGQGSVSWFALAAVLAFIILLRVGGWYKRQLATIAILKKQAEAGIEQRFTKSKVRFTLSILVLLMFSKYFFTACMTDYFTFYLINKFGLSVQNSQICLFAFLTALAVGTVGGGAIGDRFGRKYVIWGSILGAAPFALMMPYVNLPLTIMLAVLSGLIISSAFSAILVYATDLMPGRVGMIAGIFFGLTFGLGGIGSAFFGWLADLTSIDFIFHVCTLLPLLGIVAGLLPDIGQKRR